jgi:hypothetical protein
MRFALAVLGAGIAEIVPYARPATPTLLAIGYLMFAALGAGFFAGSRGWLAGALSILVGAALFGILSELGTMGVQGATTLGDFITAETGLILGVVPYAFLGALAGTAGGWLRSRAVSRR